MASGNGQPKWDIYEAVVLLDGYLETLQKNLPKLRVAKRVSADLRQMAINRGIEIDDVYRNEKGISSQIRCMESAYTGKTIQIPATNLFSETVGLYRTDKKRYFEILEQAKSMIAPKQDNKSLFLAWTASAFSAQRCERIEENILKIQQLAFERKLISGSIFDITDTTTLEAIYKAAVKNKIFQAKYKESLKDIKDDFQTYMQYCSQLDSLSVTIPKEAASAAESKINAPAAPVPEARREVSAILKQHYKYGFKYNSARELMRFRQFADAMGIALPEKDELLKSCILSAGTIIDGKVYYQSEDMAQELQHIIDDVFLTGAKVIYYELLLESQQEWMSSHAITSPDILKKYLQISISGCSFSKRFMVKGNRLSEREAVTGELKRIWGANPLESIDTLHERLPYIPPENICRIISGNNLFVLSSERKYLFLDQFRITVDEEKNILDFVDNACEKNGYASLSGIPLGSIEEENYELTRPVIYNAIYKKVLSDKYHLNGKILTKGEAELDAIILLKQYIQNMDECTFDEVAGKVVELIGTQNRQYAFQSLYDEMVRVDKNRFVSKRFVNFSIAETDAVLSKFITDNFCAIRDVSTFAMFPLCGQNWNYYLLESFCHKYSKKYSLHVIHFNNRNAGIIAEKGFNKKYDELLAIAAARTNLKLSPEHIGQYLFNAGYLAKSKYTKLDKIVQRASELRKER